MTVNPYSLNIATLTQNCNFAEIPRKIYIDKSVEHKLDKSDKNQIHSIASLMGDGGYFVAQYIVCNEKITIEIVGRDTFTAIINRNKYPAF